MEISEEDRKFATKWLYKFYRAMDNDPKVRVKAIKFLSNHDSQRFKHDPEEEVGGIHDPKTRGTYKILLNPDNWMATILVHELLHVVEPYKPHSWIEPMEEIIYLSLTNQQLTNLMARAFR